MDECFLQYYSTTNIDCFWYFWYSRSCESTPRVVLAFLETRCRAENGMGDGRRCIDAYKAFFSVSGV